MEAVENLFGPLAGQYVWRVRRVLQRRKIHIAGDWHLWVRYAQWRLSTAYGVLDSTSPAGPIGDECLADLDGQRLRSVAPGRVPRSCAFAFDLGGLLEVWPSTRIPDDQWSLHGRDGSVAAFQSDGTLVVDKAAAGGRT